MPAFAIFAPTGASNFDLGCVNGHNFHVEPMKKKIELAASYFAAASLQHDSGFQRICRGQQASSVLANALEKTLSFRFGKKDGEEGRSINDHQCGIPWES